MYVYIHTLCIYTHPRTHSLGNAWWIEHESAESKTEQQVWSYEKFQGCFSRHAGCCKYFIYVCVCLRKSVCVCVCVSVHTDLYVCVSSGTQDTVCISYMFVYVCVCVCVYVCVCLHADLYVCVSLGTQDAVFYICLCVFVWERVCVCACIHIDLYVCVYWSIYVWMYSNKKSRVLLPARRVL